MITEKGCSNTGILKIPVKPMTIVPQVYSGCPRTHKATHPDRSQRYWKRTYKTPMQAPEPNHVTINNKCKKARLAPRHLEYLWWQTLPTLLRFNNILSSHRKCERWASSIASRPLALHASDRDLIPGTPETHKSTSSNLWAEPGLKYQHC